MRPPELQPFLPSSGPRRLVLLTAYPEPGRVLLPLIPQLDPDGAADLQRVLTERLLRAARDAAQATGAELEVRFQGGSTGLMRAWLGPGVRYRPVVAPTPAARFLRTLEDGLREGADGVVALGADCPDVDARLLRRALEHLDAAGLVVGPCRGGGLWLVGVSGSAGCGCLEEAENLRVADLLERARVAGIEAAALEPMVSVDRPEARERCVALLGRGRLASGPSRRRRGPRTRELPAR